MRRITKLLKNLFFKCKRTRCDLCRNFLVESNSFLSFQTGKSYKIRPKLSCDSKNIIYLISCKRFRLRYIGSTTTDFRVRFRSHKSVMDTKKKACEVKRHAPLVTSSVIAREDNRRNN